MFIKVKYKPVNYTANNGLKFGAIGSLFNNALCKKPFPVQSKG